MEFKRFNFYSAWNLYLFSNSKYPIINVSGKRLIFVHINKTAGTSIVSAFGKKKFHLNVVELISLLGERRFNSALKFTVVRHPVDRVISQYKHLIRTNQNKLNERPLDFDKWVKMVYGENHNSKYRDKPRMFMRQVDWLKDKNGVIRVDNIIKFENLNSEFENLMSQLKLNIRLPHLNSTDKIMNPVVSRKSIDIIFNYFEEDFAFFNYKIDP